VNAVGESGWGPHAAELAVVCCVDDRIQEAARQYVRTRLSPQCFWYGMPGGALAVCDEGGPLIRALKVAVDCGVKRIAVINHTDCAAFPAFSDEEAELHAHRDSLLAARAALQREFPGAEVACVLLRGRWKVEEV
jgi:carbonic anhydrase